jgi:hypothetical protein
LVLPIAQINETLLLLLLLWNELVSLNPIPSYILDIHSTFAVLFAPDTWNFWSIAITQNTALQFFGDTWLILKTLLSHDKRFTNILFCSYALYLDHNTPFPIQIPRILINLVDSLVSIVHRLLLLLSQ